jgi:hypothetical protein
MLKGAVTWEGLKLTPGAAAACNAPRASPRTRALILPYSPAPSPDSPTLLHSPLPVPWMPAPATC